MSISFPLLNMRSSSQFMDRDMLMRFQGSSIGHKNVHEATDVFHDDRHPTDILLQDNNFNDRETPAELCKDDSKEIDDPEPEVKEEEDYGYVNSMEQDTFSEDEAPGDMDNDEWKNESELDILGPEDGDECLNNLDDLLGYTDD
ncbi:hypothetical protein H2248_010122 [Termitomyces sp. 'cryptogamus']|nr:hypothetical protein H2248_010122 [Termitomyces sp. 'cryptogamus']